MSWKRYTGAVLLFNLLGVLVVYALLRLQGVLPLNPEGLGGVPPRAGLQHGGELRHQHQLAGLRWRDHHELPDADARPGGAELRVGGHRHGRAGGAHSRPDARVGAGPRELLGRSHALHRLRAAAALARPRALLVSQGVVQTFDGSATAALLDRTGAARHEGAQQILALGPAASQIAIKQLGTNGGGFFNVNSAHPFENPTPLSNLLEVTSILLIPAALCFTFGALVKDRRQGWAVLAAMLAIFIPLLFATVAFEQAGNPALTALGWTRPSPMSLRAAATWRARRCASASPTARSGPRRPRRPPTAPSTPCTTASRRSAGSSPCGSCSSVRSSSAAWARGSTACSCTPSSRSSSPG
jgi:K+-transporting ATPase ATPase A chain